MRELYVSKRERGGGGGGEGGGGSGRWGTRWIGTCYGDGGNFRGTQEDEEEEEEGGRRTRRNRKERARPKGALATSYRGLWPPPMTLATSYDFWGTQREGAMPNGALANAFVFDDGCQDVGGEGGGERRRRKVYSKLTQEEAEG